MAKAARQVAVTEAGEIIMPEHRTRREWTKHLNTQWDDIRHTAVAGFLALGRDLLQAKADLGLRGQWMTMLESGDLKFNQSVANKLMGIATWSRQIRSIAPILQLLPPDYTTIDKITRLNLDELKRLVANGTINPSLQRNEIASILRLHKVSADEERILRLVPVEGKFRTLVIDPAWDYGHLSVAGRSQGDYALQGLEQLRALDVKAWADFGGCHLYCWVTNNFMAEACKLVEGWGFQHRTILTWVKPPPFGLGNYFRSSTEHVIFATFGKTTTRHAAASIPTHFSAPRGKHSEKPEKFYKIVRAASYPPYGEANQIKERRDFVNLFRMEEVAEAAQ